MPKKADRNQPLFTAAARALGFLVQPIHMVGSGCPDLIVSNLNVPLNRWDMLMVELKCNNWSLSPLDPRWANTWTGDEPAWHVKWRQAPVLTTNRLRHVLAWFGWTNDEIREALATLPDHVAVKAVLRGIERQDGEVSPEIMATIEFE